MPDLSTKTVQQKLKIRRDPYWMRLHKGRYLGFRRGPNTWVARYTTRNDEGVYGHQYKALEVPAFDQAIDKAEAWFQTMGSPAVRQVIRGSVRAALETYSVYLREQGREATADNADDRFRLIVWGDPLATIRLEDLTRQDFREWRERLREGRQNRSVNRHVRSIVAGLNRAVKEGHSGNPEAWAVDPLADDAEGTADATVFLVKSQRKAIIAAASPACGKFLRAIDLTGGRPGELAAATAGDFDAETGTLTLRHKKGRPSKIRARAVVLSDEGLLFFKKAAKRKLPTAPLLTDSENQPWNRHRWADQVQAAIKAVNAKAKGKKRIPFGSSAYSFRHARISELLQTYGVDPVTVAQQTGTSTRMIEMSYFKFISTSLREKLSAIEGSM